MSASPIGTPNKHVPAAFFGIVLGLVGLGSSWRMATLPALIGIAVRSYALYLAGARLSEHHVQAA
jgi:tellurite resistance protein TehA-like permease